MKAHPKKQGKRQRTTAGSAWPVAHKWIAVGTFVVYTAVGSKTVTLAVAQDNPGASHAGGSPGQSWSLTARRFDIPAASLETVLAAFQDAIHLRVEIANAALLTLAAPGVSGLYTPEQALQILLQKTGVGYHFTASGTVVLKLRGPDASIEVSEHIETPPSAKYTEPLRDTPQTVFVVPREVMEQQGTATLRDALRNVAGISLAAGEGGAQGGNLTIRGFTARNDLFIDGMRDFGSYYRDPFNMQEVQVLQGPSSVTFGRGSTGGVVNQSNKTPQLGHILSGDVDFGTDATRRVALDLNTPLRQLSPNQAFRVNLMENIGGVAGRDVAENRRFGVALHSRWALARLRAGRSATSTRPATTFRITAFPGYSTVPRRSIDTIITDSKTATTCAPMTTSALPEWSTTCPATSPCAARRDTRTTSATC
jgi:catecholate siderophore receptor